MKKRTDYPQQSVLPYLTVPVRRVTRTWRAGRTTFTITRTQKPVIPEAFRESGNDAPPSAPRTITTR